jgi:hypothetical protein
MKRIKVISKEGELKNDKPWSNKKENSSNITCNGNDIQYVANNGNGGIRSTP